VNVAYAVVGIDGVMYMMDMQCCVHIVLCTCWICSVVYGDMYMLYMQCYVHMALCECCTYGAMYIWCCVHDYTSGVGSMWCSVHVVQVALCGGGIVYMSCMWCCVHVILCTCRACGTAYILYCVHVV